MCSFFATVLYDELFYNNIKYYLQYWYYKLFILSYNNIKYFIYLFFVDYNFPLLTGEVFDSKYFKCLLHCYCGRKAGRGKGDNECYSETKPWGMLPGDQRRVTLPPRLKWPMK
jgi:hypothetical protein